MLVESTDGVDTYYDYGIERLASHSGGKKLQYVYDAGGSVVQTVTAGVVNSYAYTPFGEQLGTAVTGFGYNGEYFDAATGMLNLRARQYESGMMRFSQQDILRGDLGDAVSLNRYAYCHNNPLSFSDPSGMSIFSKLKSAAKSAVKAVKSTAKAVAAKAVSTAAKVTASVAKTVSKVATTVNKAATTVAKAASNIAANSNSKFVKAIAGGVSKAATSVAKTSEKVATTAKKVEKAATQVAKKYDKIATDSFNEAKTHAAAAAKDFNAAAKEAKEKVTCVAKKAGVLNNSSYLTPLCINNVTLTVSNATTTRTDNTEKYKMYLDALFSSFSFDCGIGYFGFGAEAEVNNVGVAAIMNCEAFHIRWDEDGFRVGANLYVDLSVSTHGLDITLFSEDEFIPIADKDGNINREYEKHSIFTDDVSEIIGLNETDIIDIGFGLFFCGSVKLSFNNKEYLEKIQKIEEGEYEYD